MIDQAEETRQMELEAKVFSHLTKLFLLLKEWDGEGYGEMPENMEGWLGIWIKRMIDKGHKNV